MKGNIELQNYFKLVTKLLHLLITDSYTGPKTCKKRIHDGRLFLVHALVKGFSRLCDWLLWRCVGCPYYVLTMNNSKQIINFVHCFNDDVNESL